MTNEPVQGEEPNRQTEKPGAKARRGILEPHGGRSRRISPLSSRVPSHERVREHCRAGVARLEPSAALYT